MPSVTCGVNGCNARLQPLVKVDPRDRETWVYPECEVCGRPACEKHSALVEGRLVCDVCRPQMEPTIPLLDVGLRPPAARP